MPAADSEKYQSRLFNFFHQQTRRWGEKVQRTFRHVKVNANWSVEALLHSAVLMMRKVIESRGKRLKSGKQQDTSTVSTEYTDNQQQELINSQGNINPSLTGSTDDREIAIETQIVHQPKGTIVFLDTAIAKFESNALVPVSQVTGGFFAFIQTQFKIFVYGQKAVEKSENKQRHGIQEFISAALDALFDRNKNNTNKISINTVKQIPLTPPPSQKSPTPNPESGEIADPWLTLNDLFGNSQSRLPEEAEIEVNNAVVNPSIEKSPRNWLRIYKQFLRQPQTDVGLVKQQPENVDITPASTSSNDTSSLSELGTTNNQIETNPDFIETQAKMVGYAQHPLEKVLAWLDNGMLWLEEKIVTVFNFIQSLWRRK
ncbi:MAG: hypothetical protein QNJ51_02060 [Calothrix sp. MO_167.B12]|nr:hypothetical protein [Calothrix sp. MO_167.B12]